MGRSWLLHGLHGLHGSWMAPDPIEPVRHGAATAVPLAEDLGKLAGDGGGVAAASPTRHGARVLRQSAATAHRQG